MNQTTKPEATRLSTNIGIWPGMKVYYITNTNRAGIGDPIREAQRAVQLGQDDGDQFIIVHHPARFACLYGIEGRLELSEAMSFIAEELSGAWRYSVIPRDLAIQPFVYGIWRRLVEIENIDDDDDRRAARKRNALLIPTGTE